MSKTRTDYDKFLELVRESGMDYKWSRMFVKKLMVDEEEFDTDPETAAWALKRGFYPGRVQTYGLTEENYRDFLPDYNYFMIHPLNHHFRKWLDKLTLKYVLNSNGCEDCMPEYYLYVENNGNYTYLMDLPKDVKKDENFILNLLKYKKILAIKPNSGTSGGNGFMKIEWKEDSIWINNKPVEFSEFETIISDLGNNIVTEYCYQHSDLAAVWPDSECTLRIVMGKMPYKNKWDDAVWKCFLSMARFGTSVSGGTSNVSTGGVCVGFDYDTGVCRDFGMRYKRYCEDGNLYCSEHPDTHVPWKDLQMPNWPIVREKIEAVCQQVASLDYLGMDIIITQRGMIICEINSHPGIGLDQIICSPVLGNKDAVEFYRYHNLFEIDNTKLYDMYMKSQIACEG